MNPTNPTYAINLDHIGMRFRLHLDKAYTLKETIVNILRKQRKYRDLWAIKDIQAEIKPGEAVAIIGRNGSGKSTLLKVIAGVLEPTVGKCQINGSLSALIELGAGFNGELTGRENVFLNGAIMGINKRQMRKLYPEIVDFAELHDFMDIAVKNYSSGMYARLGFALATSVKANIILIDEILAVGDEAFSRKCTERINQMLEGGKTVVYVSHDAHSVERLCTRAILLHHGVTIYDGPTAKALQEYRKLAS